jgi:hypothetical protein
LEDLSELTRVKSPKHITKLVLPELASSEESIQHHHSFGSHKCGKLAQKFLLWTTPLSKRDIGLLRDGAPLDPKPRMHIMLQATGIATCLENQKNGVKNQRLHRNSSGHPVLCPAKAVGVTLAYDFSLDVIRPWV